MGQAGVLPRMMAPAARRRLMTPASSGTTDLSSEKEPAVVFMPGIPYQRMLEIKQEPRVRTFGCDRSNVVLDKNRDTVKCATGTL